MSRGIWFLAGTAAGVYGMSKVKRAAELFTIDGVHDRLTGLFAGARLFSAEVRAGMGEKEAELHDRVDRVAATGPAELTATASHDVPGSGDEGGTTPTGQTGSRH